MLIAINELLSDKGTFLSTLQDNIATVLCEESGSNTEGTVENSTERQGKCQRIAEMTKFLNAQTYELQEYDDHLTRKLI